MACGLALVECADARLHLVIEDEAEALALVVRHHLLSQRCVRLLREGTLRATGGSCRRSVVTSTDRKPGDRINMMRALRAAATAADHISKPCRLLSSNTIVRPKGCPQASEVVRGSWVC